MIQPELEAASALISHALRRLAAPRELVLAYIERFREAMEGPARSAVTASEPLPRVEDVTIAAGSLADQSLREARIRERLGVTVVAVTRADGEVLVHPSAETVLRPGDTVRVFGRPEQVEAFAREARTES